MQVRPLIAGLVALAGLAGAAVAFLWQGIRWLQFETWTHLSLATALRWADGRAWAHLAARWPQAYSVLDAIPLSLAILEVAVLGFVVMKWGSNR